MINYDDVSRFALMQKYKGKASSWAKNKADNSIAAIRESVRREYVYKFLQWKRIYLLASKSDKKRIERELLNKQIDEVVWQRCAYVRS